VSDPRRLRDEGTDLEQALLGSIRADGPTDEERRRAFAAIGIGLAGVGVAPKVGVAKALAGASAATKGALIGVVALGAIATAVAWPRGAPATGTPAAAPPLAPAPVAASVPTATTTASPMPAVPSLDVRALPNAPAPSGSAPAPRAEPPAEARADTGLAAEIALLDEVRGAIATGDPSRALALLDRHGRSNGSLVHEALALRIEALVASGDEEGARRTARAFLAAHPTSPLASRIRTLAHVESDARTNP